MTSPQARWQAFRAKLPSLSRRQKFTMILAISLCLLVFILFPLPYIIPLGGLPEIPLGDLQDPNGHFIEIDGRQVYYLHHSGTGEAVIFIHGFGGSSVDWRDLLPTLNGYDTYTVDLLGFGLSEKGLDLDLSHQAQADMIAALMNRLEIRQAHIVGHDMGGNIAVHLAQRYPEQVKSLTLIAPSLIYDPSTEIPDWLLKTGFIQRWARVLLRRMMPEATEINLYSAAARDEMITDALIEDSQRTYHTEDWDLSLLALARDNSHSALGAPLQTLDVPTLIVWGESDRWLSPDTAIQIQHDIPGAGRVMLPGVGHLPMHEAPDELREALTNFWEAAG